MTTGVRHGYHLANTKQSAELPAEGQPGRTVPALLGSCSRANTEPSEGWQKARR